MTVKPKWLNLWLKLFNKALPLNLRYRPVVLTLSLGTLLSFVASVIVWNWEQQRLQTEFQNQADRVAATLQQSIDSNLEVLRATGKLYVASQSVTRQEFKVFVRDFLLRYPSIRAMNWTMRVSAQERLAYEKAMQTEGYLNFQIKEPLPNGKSIPASKHPEHFVVTYAEPVQTEPQALGLDIGAEPRRRSAMERARDTGEMSSTERVQLILEQEKGFLTFQPIYRRGEPLDSVQVRRQNLLGFVVGVFSITDIVRTPLLGMELDNIDFYLYDNSAEGQERFLSFYQSSTQQVITQLNPEQLNPKNGRRRCIRYASCTHILSVADRQWSLLIVPGSRYFGIPAHGGSLTTLGSGLLLTLILAFYLLMAQRHTAQVEQLVQERTTQAKQLKQALHDLQQTQSQLIQTEKMSSLGQMVAGVAHEINNPVNFIYGNLTHTDEYTQDLLKLLHLYQESYPDPSPEIQEHTQAIDLDFLIEDLPKMLSSMKVGADRIREIVLSLRTFSRLDEAEMKPVDLHEGIDSTLLILQNRLKAKPEHPGIEVVKEYGKLPLVECYAGQLNQVFMNILSNAIDAMEKQSEGASFEEIQENHSQITIRTESHSNYVTVRIADNGPGMTAEVKQRLFDPFFTTKPVGQGTGLGLSICYQIVVEKHKGMIRCESSSGKGTEFWIEIPVHQEESKA